MFLPRRLLTVLALAIVLVLAYFILSRNAPADESELTLQTQVIPGSKLTTPSTSAPSSSSWLSDGFRRKLLNTVASHVIAEKANDLVEATGPDVKFLIYLHPTPDFVSDAIRQKGLWKDCLHHIPNLNRLLADSTRPKVVLDIGGNIGSCALMYASMGLKVTSFEPADRNYRLFAASIRANIDAKILDESSVTLYPAGASDVEEEKTIYTEEGNNGNSIIAKTQGDTLPKSIFAISSDHQNYRYTPSSILTLPVSNVLHTRVGFAKIDCQGYELYALRGMKSLVETFGVDEINFEFAPLWAKNAGVENPVEVLKVLDGYGYTIVRESGDDVLRPEEFERFAMNFGELAEDLTAYSNKVFKSVPMSRP